MLPIPKEEKITSVLAVQEFTDDDYLIMLTQGGYIKKTALSAFSNIRANGLIAISLEDGDELKWVRLGRTSDTILIGSHKGMAIHFKADNEQLRPLGRPTRGVRAMNLRDGDQLISMDILPAQVMEAVADQIDDAADVDEADGESDEVAARSQGPWVLVITAGGLGKRVPVSMFRLQNRAGMGLQALKFRMDNDSLVSLLVVNEDEELMLVTNRGIIIRQHINKISIQSRAAQGVRVQRLDNEDAIAAVAVVPQVLESDDSDDAETDEAVLDVEASEAEANAAVEHGSPDADSPGAADPGGTAGA
jgi:DNA gyrase subunit A